MARQTNYLLFIDESGTHDMHNVDPRSPVFVLLGLLVGEVYYAKTLVPRVRKLKLRHGLTVDSVLHSRHIRRWEGDFAFLQDPKLRSAFYEGISGLFRQSRIRLYAVVVDKVRLRDRYLLPMNPYDVSLSQLLSLVCGPPGLPGLWRPNVGRIVAESRGKREDKELQAVYQGFRKKGFDSYGAPDVPSRRPSTVARLFPPRVDFIKKAKVLAGLELADLAAYPIGRAVITGDWSNPSYLVLAEKLRAPVLTFP
jgi:hypothetical protein